MFDEMPDQFYQFLASTNNNNNTTTTSNNNNNINVPNVTPHFDGSYYIHEQQLPLHHQQQQQLPRTNEAKDGDNVTSCVTVPWSNEEVIALVKIRSSMDNHPWFVVDDFTWETVSRKLEEIGFKRSAQNCKDKFEEETKSFNNNIIVNKNNIITQNYRLFGELEELYNPNNHMNDHSEEHPNPNDPRPSSSCEKNQNHCMDDENEDETVARDVEMGENIGKKKRRKRVKKFELFKGFCEKIVNKMMVQQEEFHCKIIDEMVKRDQENIVRENDWKKQEIDLINKELEVRAHEKAIVGDRQAKIFRFLKNFSSTDNSGKDQLIGDIFEHVSSKVPNDHTTSLSNSSSILSQSCSISSLVTQQKCDLPNSLSKKNLASKNPNDDHVTIASQGDLSRITSISNTDKVIASNHTSTDATDQQECVKDDIGRRWPRDEVIALINIKCNLVNNTSDQYDKENISKGPLWERISQKMTELGYKRSSKRCKEKWENINKYFKKTKDLNKKRSVDSRTCPYFHQLSHYYNQGSSPLHGHGQPDRLVNHIGSPDNSSMALSDAHQGGSTL